MTAKKHRNKSNGSTAAAGKCKAATAQAKISTSGRTQQKKKNRTQNGIRQADCKVDAQNRGPIQRQQSTPRHAGHGKAQIECKACKNARAIRGGNKVMNGQEQKAGAELKKDAPREQSRKHKA
jgi:hypothetical protein